jgi:hypothetical protein
MAVGGKRLFGKTLDVYLCILTSPEPMGVREIWRELGFSSPRLAQYHVNKLTDLSLIKTDIEGKYIVNEEERIEALRSFLMLRGMLIPRLVVYAALITGLFASYMIFWPWHGDFRDMTTVLISVISVGGILIEAYKQYNIFLGLKKET